jgi:beta-lactam-binding protein with PASTA domain
MDPRPATSVSVDTLVTVYFSDGPEEVPSVVGMKENAARQAIEEEGFDVNVVYDTETRSEKGIVLEQSPEAGSTQSKGSTVTITVSDYEEPEPTPDPTLIPEPTEPTETPSPTPTETPTESPDAGIAPGTSP